MMRITMTPKDPQKGQRIFEGVIHFETYTSCSNEIRECIRFDWAEGAEPNGVLRGLHHENFCLDDYSMCVETAERKLTEK